MSRVVTAATLGPGARRLGAAPREELDPVVRDLVEAARAEGYERGHREGQQAGRVEAERAAETRIAELGASLSAAIADAVSAVRRSDGATVASAVDLALTIAETVLGREPHDGGAAIAARVQAALDDLEDPAPTVCVHPEDVAVVTAALAGHRDVAVDPDASLAPGEARIRGAWAQAELTHAAAFAAVRRELGVDG